MLPQIRVVLVETSHPGNIGSTARAMKNMGLAELVLVSPKEFPHAEADALAAGADDVLASARVVDSLDAALADCQLAFGTTARPRFNEAPSLAPRETAAAVLSAVQQGMKVAVVFGTERTGLTNTELGRCQHAVRIPTNPEFSSLNLAQAVQLIAYELRLASMAFDPVPETEPRPLATLAEFEGFMGHLETTLALIDFYKGREYTRLLQRFRRLYQRAQLGVEEVQLLRGVLAETERSARLAPKTVDGNGLAVGAETGTGERPGA
ncbi:tRNA (cytosine(32)/uridine(32)-2'-O)-methyltransferase TrmJ [Ahniella affigens]|uniref:tRNA (cytidine/uridine-2'-O-)-methyltransferase TrmJ n=1 Tax=Ahniella affigens TaxID=2021234 RepID=A0A2P1PZ62_9GAMM|nr:tRNA (cytosine(32)/uridine(32)-2'-O)-methyltransferase TrmJ [Ahniella affigens]